MLSCQRMPSLKNEASTLPHMEAVHDTCRRTIGRIRSGGCQDNPTGAPAAPAAAGATEVKATEEVGASAVTAECPKSKTADDVGGQEKPKGAPAAPAAAGADEGKTTKEVGVSVATAEARHTRAVSSW